MKINFRPLFVGFINLILGIIVFVYVSFETNVNSIFCVTIYSVINFLLLVLYICACFKNRNKFFEKLNKFKPLIATIILSTIVACVLVNVVISNFKVTTKETEVIVEAKIEEVNIYKNFVVVDLVDVKIENKNVSGKLELSFTIGDNANLASFREGNFVTFNALVTATPLNYSALYKLYNNVKFSANAKFNEITIINGSSSFKTNLKEGVLNNLSTILNEENSNLAYSMLFGKSGELSEEVYHAFSFSGIAHILAVSGLHIGFLVALLISIFNALKCNKNFRNIFIFVILLFYAYLTNFTPSVLRAVIMSMVLLLSKSYGKHYDALSSLSLSGIIILIINPFSLFNIGFQLSFACVFSIITLTNGLKSILEKIKCPKVLANSLAISVAVNLGVLAITATHFNNINFMSVFSNLIILPLFSVCYVFMFLIGFLGLIHPILNFLLFFPNIILHFIKLIANLLASINILNFDVFHISYIVVFVSLLIIYIAKFLIAKLNIKIVLCAILVVLTVGATAMSNQPANFKKYELMLNYSRYGNNAVIATPNNKKILTINNLVSIDKIADNLNRNKISKLDAIIAYDFGVKDTENLKTIIKKYKVNKLYVDSNFRTHIINNFSTVTNITFVEDNFIVYDIHFTLVYGVNSIIGINSTINNNDILLLSDNIAKADLVNLYDSNFNYIISNNNNYDFASFNIVANVYITYRQTKQLTNNVVLYLNDYFTKIF